MKEVRWWVWRVWLVAVLCVAGVVVDNVVRTQKAAAAEVEKQAKHDAEIRALADEAVARARANLEAAKKEAADARLAQAESTATLAKLLLSDDKKRAEWDTKREEIRGLWARSLAEAKTPEERASIKVSIDAGERKMEASRKRFEEASKQAREILEESPIGNNP